MMKQHIENYLKKLEWVTINNDILNIEKFSGNYNIPHIITQIKVYLKNEKRN